MFEFFPDNIENYKKEEIKVLNKFFAYKIIPVNKNSKTANNIFLNLECSCCNSKLFVVDIYNRGNLRASFFRMCHRCNIIYLLTGSFLTGKRFNRVIKEMNIGKRKKIKA